MLKKNKNFVVLYFYSHIYFIKFPIKLKDNVLSYNQITNQVVCYSFYNTTLNILYNQLLIKFNSLILKPSFKKLKFKGKGYYIYKNYRNTITPQFGFSHRLYLYTYFLHVNFLSKTSLVIFGTNFLDIQNLSKKLYL